MSRKDFNALLDTLLVRSAIPSVEGSSKPSVVICGLVTGCAALFESMHCIRPFFKGEKAPS